MSSSDDRRQALQQLLGKKSLKAPQWLVADGLPPLLWETGESADIAGQLLDWLRRQAASLDCNVGADELSALAAGSLERLLHGVFDQWQSAGAPGKFKWILQSLALAPTAGSADRIGRWVRRLPTRSQFQKGSAGIETLSRMKGDAATAELAAIVASAKSPGLRRRIDELLDERAAERGLTTDDLLDRIIPTLGFGSDGRMPLDFGLRQFLGEIRPGPSLALLDADGSERKTLPKPNASDDPGLTVMATVAWSDAKATLKDLPKQQWRRLEHAMTTGRRWPAPLWRQSLLDHPVMRMLLQPVLWAAYRDNEPSPMLFRVAEDATLADIDDREWTLTDDCRIGVPHPAELDESTKKTWTSLFADYTIRPPFEQLDRVIFRPTAEERGATELVRYVGYTVQPIVLREQFARREWVDITATLPYGNFAHSREFPTWGTTVVIFHGGLWMGESAPPIFETVFLNRTPTRADMLTEDAGNRDIHESRLSLGAAPAIAFSEAVRDLDAIARSGQGRDERWLNRR